MDAILSIDAYNEGSAIGMVLPNNVVVGGATKIADSTTALKASQGIDPTQYSFYPTAYEWTDSSGNAQTIIAYRGTMITGTGLFGIDLGDQLYGWPVGAGSDTAMQAQLALQFYQQIAIKTDSLLAPGGAIVTDALESEADS